MASKVEYQDLEVKGTVKAKEFADGVLKNSGFEVVTALPTTGLFAGREVMYNGKKYVYSSGWKEEITEDTMYEANLLWGGKNISNGCSPIDSAMMPEVSSNMMAFPKTAGISIEYSRDGGVTWLDYKATDKQKVELFTKNTFIFCGKTELDNSTATVGFQVRITITPILCDVYISFNKIIMKINTIGTKNSWCTFKGLKSKEVAAGNEDDSYYDTFVDKAKIFGTPAYSVLNFQDIRTSQTASASKNDLYYRLRLIFGYDDIFTGTTYSGTYLSELRFFGLGHYSIPSNLAINNHLYAYDWLQNAFFPAKVESKELINFDINNIEPTQIGTVSKTSTWLWQYLVQGVNWLRAKINNSSMSLNGTTVNLGDSAILPWYLDYNEVDYPARIREHWLQIYRNGVWANLVYLGDMLPTQVGQITSLDNLDWYNEQVSEYEVDSNTTTSILNGKTLPAAVLFNCSAEQLTFSLYPISGGKYGKGALDSLILDLQGKGFSVFVENDLDAILASGSDYLVRIKISKVPTAKAIIECYVAR